MKYPFVHEELEVKQNFLNVARGFAQSQDAEKQFAAALLYANLADYLGAHLLESLKLTAQNATRTFLNGAIVVSLKDSSNKPLGVIIQELEQFIFPSKELILPLLKKVKGSRDKIMHQLLKTPSAQLGDIDQAFNDLIQDAEQLVIFIDDIYRSLPPKTILESVSPSNIPDPNTQEATQGILNLSAPL
jgi:hypothetical protein